MQGPLHAGVAALSLEHDVTILVGEGADCDPAIAQQSDALFFTPDGYLCGWLARAIVQARDSGEAVAIRTDSGPVLVCPKQDVALADMSETSLRYLASVHLQAGRVAIEAAAGECPEEADNMALRRGTDGLLWMSTLWAARGRVPRGTSLNADVVLHRWPNMTRLLLFPHCLRIAALWAKEPVSLLETARRLAIPQRFVFSFYSAAHALGLAETEMLATSMPDKAVETAETRPPQTASAPRRQAGAETMPAADRQASPGRAGQAASQVRAATEPAPARAKPATRAAPAGVAAGTDARRPAVAPKMPPHPRPSRQDTVPERRPPAEKAPESPPLTESEEKRLDAAIKQRNERMRRLREQQHEALEQQRSPEVKKGVVARFFGALFGRKS